MLSEDGIEFLTGRTRLFYHNHFRDVMVKTFRANPEISPQELEEVIKADLVSKVEELRKISFKWYDFAFVLDIVFAKVDYTRIAHDLHNTKKEFLP